MNCNPPGSSIHEISQARILGWVAISFPRGSSQSRDQTCVSCSSLLWQADSLPSERPGKPHLYVYLSLFYIFCSITVYCKILNIVPCATQYFSLVIYFVHSIKSVYLSVWISQFLSPPWYPYICSLRLCLHHFSRFHVCASQVAHAGDIREVGSIPGLGRSPGEGNGNPPQYSCLGNPMDKDV